MKHFDIPDVNTPEYWDKNQTAFDFGLRQQKYLDLAGSGESICEVGCGLSPFLTVAQKHFPVAVGYDFSSETVRRGGEEYPNVHYFQLNANDLWKLDTKYEVVVAGEIIEHLQDPDTFLEQLCRIAKRRVILSTPNLEFLDKEHIWEFDEQYFNERGFQTEVVESERFPGRKYIFAYKDIK